MRFLRHSAVIVTACLLLLVGCWSDEPDTGDAIAVTDATFQETVLNSDKPVLLDFYTDS